jgi:hypothetical protein
MGHMHERIAANEAVHGIVDLAAIADQRAGIPGIDDHGLVVNSGARQFTLVADRGGEALIDLLPERQVLRPVGIAQRLLQLL